MVERIAKISWISSSSVVGDIGAATAFADDQPFTLQPVQRLTDRRLAGAHGRCDLKLNEPIIGLKTSSDDVGAQTLVDLLR